MLAFYELFDSVREMAGLNNMCVCVFVLSNWGPGFMHGVTIISTTYVSTTHNNNNKAAMVYLKQAVVFCFK